MNLLSQLMAASANASDDRLEAALKAVRGEVAASSPRSEEPILLNMVSAARRLGVSRTHLWKLIKAGRIRKIETLPGCYRIAAADLDAFVAGGRVTQRGTGARGNAGQAGRRGRRVEGGQGARVPGEKNFTRRSGGGDDEAQQTEHRSIRA